MWNIMKAQNYQAKRDNLTIYLFLLCLVLSFVVIDYGSVDELSGSLLFAGSGEIVMIVSLLVVLVLVSRICGWDIADKTMNYEILSGHARAEVYFGRVITGILWSVVSCMVLIAIPVLLFTIINGFGKALSLPVVLEHYVLLLFPLLRLACEMALLTFLVGNCYAAILIGWMLMGFSMYGIVLAEGLFDIPITFHLTLANITTLFRFDNYRLVELDGEAAMVFENNLEPSLVAGTIVVSLVAGGICLLLGYLVFRKRDLS